MAGLSPGVANPLNATDGLNPWRSDRSIVCAGTRTEITEP